MNKTSTSYGRRGFSCPVEINGLTVHLYIGCPDKDSRDSVTIYEQAIKALEKELSK